MKKKLLITILILTTNFIFSQSVLDLDIKNGFRHFKLGSSPNQIKNIKKTSNQHSKNPNVAEFLYVGDDIIYISNVKVGDIKLSFFKNKLFNIAIEFGDLMQSKNFEEEDYMAILSSLERTYGKDWSILSDKDNVIIDGAQWVGKNATLELCRLDFSNSKKFPKDYDFISGFIAVYDNKLSNEMYSTDF